MDTAKITDCLDTATKAIAVAREELLRPDAPPIIRTPAQFELATVNALPYAVLTLGLDFVYTPPVAIAKPLTLIAEGAHEWPMSRVPADRPLPQLWGGLQIPSDQVTLLGIEVRYPDPRGTIVGFTGHAITLDRIRVLGDPTKGAKRGIQAHGNGACTIRDSIIDDCFSPYPTYDAQAIYSQDMAPGLDIINCLIRGGTESLMLGGGDIASADRIPRTVRITNCDLTKRAEWQALAVSVKNLVEFKCAIDVEMRGCRLSNCWGGRGQSGYAIVITPRNQEGHNPFATCEDITITDNDISDVAAFLLVAGDDDRLKFPSQIASRISVLGNRGIRIDPVRYTGSPHLMEISRGPRHVQIVNNDLQGTKISATVYFHSPARLCDELAITDNHWPTSKYGVFGDALVVGQTAWQKYVAPNGVLSGNTTYPLA